MKHLAWVVVAVCWLGCGSDDGGGMKVAGGVDAPAGGGAGNGPAADGVGDGVGGGNGVTGMGGDTGGGDIQDGSDGTIANGDGTGDSSVETRRLDPMAPVAEPNEYGVRIPQPTGACPSFATGTLMFSPLAIEPRAVDITMGSSSGGALVFYFHAFLTNPMEAGLALSGAIDEITAGGGMVVAPHSDPLGAYEWFLTDDQVPEHTYDDLYLIDEIVACAVEQGLVDSRRIHMLGMSAGGTAVAQMGFYRSRYWASIATYSGGLTDQLEEPGNDDASNHFAALLFHGGALDTFPLFNFDFALESANLRDRLDREGHYWILCDHGLGHTLPTEDGPSAVWRFFQDHPYGTDPSPYASGGLPPEIPDYCTSQ